MHATRTWAILACLFGLIPSTTQGCDTQSADEYQIGVFYYPGWHDPTASPLEVDDPWAPIRPFSHLEPLLGFYRGTDSIVVSEHARWLCDFSVDYIAFDWYFGSGVEYLQQPLEQFVALQSNKPKFSLMWANHGAATTDSEWRAIVKTWVDRYFDDPSYYKIDGRNVVFVFSATKMAEEAAAAGLSLRAWIAAANLIAEQGGLGPIYFVGGVRSEPLQLGNGDLAALSGLSAYNYHAGPGDERLSHGFDELDRAYRRHWEELRLSYEALPLIVPMTSGWDKRPWGGSEDPLHDDSTPTISQFRDHLIAARDEMKLRGTRHGVICCWNEYGEGSVLEPTKSRGTSMLEEVQSVFGGTAPH